MAGVEPSGGGRRLLQWGYYTYNTNSNRWLYWTIPIIAVGVGAFVFAVVLYWCSRLPPLQLCLDPWKPRHNERRRRIRRRRRFQNAVPLPQQGPSYGAPYGTAYGTPVTGYPQDQYAQYNNYSSQPPPYQPYPQQQQQQQQPGASSWSQPPPAGKAGSVEMGSTPYSQPPPYSGYPRGA